MRPIMSKSPVPEAARDHGTQVTGHAGVGLAMEHPRARALAGVHRETLLQREDGAQSAAQRLAAAQTPAAARLVAAVDAINAFLLDASADLGRQLLPHVVDVDDAVQGHVRLRERGA